MKQAKKKQRKREETREKDAGGQYCGYTIKDFKVTRRKRERWQRRVIRKACFKHYSQNGNGLKGNWEKKRELVVEV